jgi:hypothetical protein
LRFLDGSEGNRGWIAISSVHARATPDDSAAEALEDASDVAAAQAALAEIDAGAEVIPAAWLWAELQL